MKVQKVSPEDTFYSLNITKAIMALHRDYEKYIKHSKEGALRLIADIALDYDGYDSIPELKWLIDELRAIALLGLKM